MSQPSSPLVFDRTLIRERREHSNIHNSDCRFLFDWALHNLCDRLHIVKRDFPLSLHLGARHSPALNNRLIEAGGIDTLITADSAASILPPHKGYGPVAAFDEEHLPLSAARFDMVASNLSLHTVNDLPGTLIQIRRALKADGLFLGTMLGGQTLHELRTALMQAEIGVYGGVSPRVAPFADKQQIGALMQRAGYALPVVDSEIITVSYKELSSLFKDLKIMGESNCLLDRSKTLTSPGLFAKAEEIYMNHFCETDTRGDKNIIASFEVIFMIGWAPHQSQQQPLRPGSATKSLAEALQTDEIKTGAPTGPPES